MKENGEIFMTTLLISFIPAIISGLLAYLGSTYKTKKEYQAKSEELELKNRELEQRLTEIETKHKHEVEMLKLQYELQAKSEYNSQVANIGTDIAKDILGKAFKGKTPQQIAKMKNPFG
ncbi:hypothetical protein [Lactococcus lactis]|nr:hypothetical protein [Lactococcus lactis]